MLVHQRELPLHAEGRLVRLGELDGHGLIVPRGAVRVQGGVGPSGRGGGGNARRGEARTGGSGKGPIGVAETVSVDRVDHETAGIALHLQVHLPANQAGELFRIGFDRAVSVEVRGRLVATCARRSEVEDAPGEAEA